MTGTLRAMHAESVAALAKMQALAYDPLDVSQQAFVVDYAAYQIATNSIERRLAGILKTVWRPCTHCCSCVLPPCPCERSVQEDHPTYTFHHH